MTQEALKLALELKNSASAYWTENEIPIIEKLIKLLAQPEPFGYFKAEPFGWTDCAETDEGAVALYQVPPQRTWVGLTDEDWKEIEDMPDTFDQGVAWAQAKLKDKNNAT